MEQLKTSFINSDKLPQVIEPVNTNLSFQDTVDLLVKNEKAILESVETYGGVLFRGFPVGCIDDFVSMIETLKLGRFLNYIGGDSPRDKITQKVYTSTEAPPSIHIPLHNELSFISNYPLYIHFYCEIAPKVRGATIIGDARKMFLKLNKKVQKKLDEKGLKYISHYHGMGPIMKAVTKFQRGHKSWMEVFETNDRSEVEEKCRQNEFGYKWLRNGWLEITHERPATLVHPKTKDKVFFCQPHLYDFNPRLIGGLRYIGAKLFYCLPNTKPHEVRYGDDTPMPRDEVYHIMNVLDENTISFPWRKGDVMMLDNILAMHGRESFEGKRRILTAMTK